MDNLLESDDVSSLSRSCPSSIWLVPAAEINIAHTTQSDLRSSPIIPADDIKLRKRRESHNAVERRRRDHINEMIQKLNSLISTSEECLDEGMKSNKGEILARTVDYITSLQIKYQNAVDHIKKIDPYWAEFH